jgi:acyl-CoA reductase-like NAD-dependent aldehyde dehydrogenase
MDSGLPGSAVQLLSESPEEAQQAIDSGADKVVFTGSNSSGRAVMERLARYGTPSVMELSGDDSVFVRPGADIDLVIRALRFGMTFNHGDTCIAPKRVIVWPPNANAVGARLHAERICIPVIEFSSDDEALAASAASGYALGATVFGPDEDAINFARRINAGSVVVNDMIVPTADPRLPFGGRGNSGFGVTRGAEGLLEMTAVKTIAVRRTRWLPHLDPARPSDAQLFHHYIRWSHRESIQDGVRALAGVVRALIRRS